MKIVTITLEMDSHFISMLNANVQLSNLPEKSIVRQLTPMETLALLVLMEARGAPVEQIDATMRDEYRDNLRAVHVARKVLELAQGEPTTVSANEAKS